MTTPRPLPEVRDDAVRLARAYRSVADDRELRPPIMRELASVVLELRQLFTTEAGQPDWTGRSYAYRMALGEILSDAGIRRAELASFQAALRYHVGNQLRERLDDEQLAELGLLPTSPTERGRAARARNRTEREAVRARNPETIDVDALRALEGSRALLSRLDPATLATMPTKERKLAREALSGLRAQVDRLDAGLKARRSRSK